MSQPEPSRLTVVAQLRDRRDALLRHPAAAAFLSFLLLITGGVGSIYSNEIRNAFPFTWRPFGSVSGPATTFWVMAVVSGLLFFLRQRATDRAREQSQNEIRDEAGRLRSAQSTLVDQSNRLLDKTDRFETLLRTMPPENFLEQFVELYATADSALEEALNSKEGEREVRMYLCILLHLRIVAHLAKKFDGDRTGARYAANIMVFRPSARLTPEEKEAYSKDLRFCDPSTDCGKLLGILELIPKLSSTDTEELAPDDQLPRLVLPIPLAPKSRQDHWLVLPGAPLAFVTRKASAFADTRGKLREWLDNEGDFQQEVKTALESYFQEDSNLRSFVSIPLLSAEGLYGTEKEKEAAPPPAGVLNIHVNSPGLLRGADWAEPGGSSMVHFYAIIQPFALNLVKLLSANGDTSRRNEAEIEKKP